MAFPDSDITFCYLRELWFLRFAKILLTDTARFNNLMSGKVEQAEALYEKVLGLEPDHQVALVNLAKINYRLGKNEISRSYLERALKLDLPQGQAAEMTQLLKNFRLFDYI